MGLSYNSGCAMRPLNVLLRRFACAGGLLCFLLGCELVQMSSGEEAAKESGKDSDTSADRVAVQSCSPSADCSAKVPTQGNVNSPIPGQRCTPDCRAKCLGASDGCGGRCLENQCPGCCDDSNQCRPGSNGAQCGVGGLKCLDCSGLGFACLDGLCAQAGSNGCSVQSCAGCCKDGACQRGDSADACGLDGGNCASCGDSLSCSDGRCAAVCASDCLGKCAGADDGCGMPCLVNDCDGCCDGSLVCHGGAELAQCGSKGASCSDCSTQGFCNNGVCAENCVPSCVGKCPGASDGCTGTCTQNDCSGCCSTSNACKAGNTGTACGTGGTTCAECAPGASCDGTGCVAACLPSCAGKCAGASDGCNGICTENHCDGCCDAFNICKAGASTSACGKDGDACMVCAANFLCTGNECTCTPNCTGKCGGVSDGCGGFCNAACSRGYIIKGNSIQAVDYLPGAPNATACKEVESAKSCAGGNTPQGQNSVGQCVSGISSSTIFQSITCDCRACDGSLTCCNNMNIFGCSYYSCSNQCHPTGTSSCTAGCGC